LVNKLKKKIKNINFILLEVNKYQNSKFLNDIFFIY
jgi:hypothetical protein